MKHKVQIDKVVLCSHEIPLTVVFAAFNSQPHSKTPRNKRPD
jgi:hypothetical protein